MSQRRSVSVVVVWAILFLALMLRLYRLNAQSMWWDEGHSLFVARHNLGAIPTLPEMDVHPPLYFWWLHLWIGLFDTSEFALRFLSVTFGLLTVALMYRVGRAWLGPLGGVLAAILAALSPLYLAYSQEVRMYALVSVLSLLSLYLFGEYLCKRGILRLAIYVAATAAGLYSHYFVGFLLIFENTAWLSSMIAKGTWRQSGEWLRWIGAQLGILVLLSPQIYTASRQITSYKNVNLAPPSIPNYLVEIWRAFTLFVPTDSTLARAAMGAIGAMLGLGLLMRYFPRPDRTVAAQRFGILLGCFVVPLGIYYLVLLDRASFSPRYMIVVTPALYLLMSFAIWQLARRWLPLGVVAGMTILGVFAVAGYAYFFDPTFAKDDTRGLSQFLESQATAQDIVFIDVPHPLDYYYHGAAPESYLFVDIHTIADVLTKKCADRKRLFFVRWRQSDTDPRGAVLFLLEKYGSKLGEKRFRGYDVVWYALPSPARFTLPTDLAPTRIDFQGAVLLTGVAYGGRGQGAVASESDVSRPEVPAGRSAWATLSWQVPKGATADYKAAIYLRDPRGHLISQVDKTLLNDRHLRTRAWQPGESALNVYTLPVPFATPPGTYTMEVTVYRADDPTPLSVLDERGAPCGVTAKIGQLTVARPLQPPDPTELDIPNRVNQGLNDDLRLLGYELPTTEAQAGTTLRLSLWWQAQRDILRNLKVWLALSDEAGAVQSESVLVPVGGTYPTAGWIKKEIVHDRVDFLIPAQLTPGNYRLRIGVVSPGTDRSPREVDLGRIVVTGRAHRFEVPAIDHPLSANFGGEIELLGYRLGPGSLTPGSTLSVTLYWRAQTIPSKSYKVFTHVLGANKKMWGQKDDIPGSGTLPTSGWVKGEVIEDSYAIPINVGAPPGNYELEVGFYDAVSGARLSLLDEAGKPSADSLLIPLGALGR